MEDNREQMPEAASSRKMIFAMGGVGLSSALLIVLTYYFTLPIITVNREAQLQKAIFDVLPGAVEKTDFALESNELFPAVDGAPAEFRVYAGYGDNGGLVGVALEARGRGFQDVIHILYGYSTEKQAIIGIKVLASTETPGLGDKIEKDPEFLANFRELPVRLNNNGDALIHTPSLVKKENKENPWEITAITGATISSRAIADMLASSASENVPLIYRLRDQLIRNQANE